MPGWYDTVIYSSPRCSSITILKNDLGMWELTVQDVKTGEKWVTVTDSLKSAKALGLSVAQEALAS